MSDPSIFDTLHKRLGDRIDEFLIPPPIFKAMRGEFLTFDPEAGMLITRFPILTDFLNPYGAMQGGMVAAAVDNTIGPLSMLVAPPNVTRRLELKYSQPVTPDLVYITVEGKYLGREGRELIFTAKVRDTADKLLARARAVHWILDEKRAPRS